MIGRIGAREIAAVLVLFACGTTVAGELGWSDYATGEPEESGVSLTGGVGVVRLEAHEYVYAGSGSEALLSHLIWQSTAPMLSAGIAVKAPEGWTLAAKAQVAMSGDSYMEDFDWFGPAFVSFDSDDWTHRSQHDDTNLDWYFNGSLLVGYDMPVSEGMRVNLNGGLKYTDVQWAAYGGSFVYSDFEDGDPCGFRGCVGDFSDGEPGITYRQTFPALVAGIDGEISDGPWTVTGSAQVGATFYAQGDDHHWQRNLNFIDTLNPAPLVTLGASVRYQLGDGLDLFVEGTAEQVFTARGDTESYRITDGVYDGTYVDGGGGDLFAASLSAGLKGSF
ncbi:omptin family outer membrane protease [Devosia sp. ZB163]|uniref:omptin family outer membrane protease n=1 Tax=Devosia sp. ZB163 TaxID=3025938 RepID=UPI002360B73A|nr:omptin family outer membrane protease [Devosia sp. ZB163]MDC9822132.1 omptin family outer membrane protease [Devosia sp. ZB163]